MMALPVVFIGFLLYLRDKFFEYVLGPIIDKITSWFNFKNYKQKEKFETVLFLILGIGCSLGLVGSLFLIGNLTH